MEISITKKNVYQYAMALTARAATATGDYAQTALTEDNYPVLDVYLSEAVPLVEGELRKKLKQSNAVDMILEEDAILISLKEQRRADLSVYNLIESGIRLFTAYYIASRWLQTTPATALAETYGATAVTHLKTATDAVYQKDMAVVSEADYSEREGDASEMDSGTSSIDYADREGDSSKMDRGTYNTDYAAREGDSSKMGSSHITASDYGKRAVDITDMSEYNGQVSSYDRRKRDNVMARPGIRITDGELLAVCSDEDCGIMTPAVTRNKERLISNQ